MREDPDNHRQLFDGGDDLKLAATLRAVFEVDSENAPEQARPAHARRCFMRVVACIIAGFLRRTRHDRRAQIKGARLDYSRLEWQLPNQISAPRQVIRYKKGSSAA